MPVLGRRGRVRLKKRMPFVDTSSLDFIERLPAGMDAISTRRA
jgi:hypothetical protein